MFQACGRNVTIEPGASFGGGSKVKLGDYSGLGKNARIPNNIEIGNHVMIGQDVLVIGQNHNFSDSERPMREQGLGPVLPVVIEDDVWIGSRVIILPGRRIGSGAVVGAGAVVTRDVRPYDIVGGNPARVIRNRLAENE
jgi:maltose O-acetyltransferase